MLYAVGSVHMTFGSRVTIHARPTAHLNKYPIASNKSYPSTTAKGGVAFKYLQYIQYVACICSVDSTIFLTVHTYATVFA